MVGGVSSTTGSSLVWGCQKLGTMPAADTGFDDCVSEALEIEPGAGGVVFLPFLAGERNPYWNDRLRGGFYGLQLAHDRRHMVRAVMEGVAFSLRHFLDLYAELGMPVGELALAGGGAATQGWPQIIADACGHDVAIYAGQETVTRVLYALCQQHLGRGSLDEGLLQTFDAPALVRCNSRVSGVYDEGYERYRAFVGFALRQSGTPAW
jgi:sugar (pentulose or hexulose) kinase